MDENIKQLSLYINEQRKNNIPEEKIREAIISQGWSEDDLSQALSISSPSVPTPPTPPTKQEQEPVVDTNQGSTVDQPENPLNNIKFKVTLKTLLIASTVVYVVERFLAVGIVKAELMGIFGAKNIKFKYIFEGVEIGLIIKWLIYGLIYSAISAVIFYFLYTPIKNWVKTIKPIRSYVVNMFTLTFYSYSIFVVINALLSLLDVLEDDPSLFILGLIIIPAAIKVGVSYLFAKFVSKKLEAYYPW